MDQRGHKEARSPQEITSHKGRGKHTRKQIEASRGLQKPYNAQTCSLGRNAKEDAQEKVKKKSIYAPIREEIMVLICYLDLMEKEEGIHDFRNLNTLLEVLEIVHHKCDFYIKYQLRNNEWN